MICVMYDDIVRRFITEQPTHHFIKELLDAIQIAQFELTKETLADVHIAMGKVIIYTGGDVQCLVQEGEYPYPRIGHA